MNPHVFELLPDKFELVILPEYDPEIRLHNLELLDMFGKEDKPVVFARVKSSLTALFETIPPNLYARVAKIVVPRTTPQHEHFHSLGLWGSLLAKIDNQQFPLGKY